MKIVFFINSFIFLLLFCTPSFGQLDRANKCYDDKDYSKAAKLYEDILKKNENPEALEKIANCYRLLKNYDQAELYYIKVVKLPNIAPINYLFYGMVLKKNNKIDEALIQFKLYSQAVPNDKVVGIVIKSCDDAKTLLQKRKQFDIAVVPNINSAESEFSPVIFKDKLVFVANRTKDLTNSGDEQHFLQVYSSEIKKGKDGSVELSKKTEPFSWPINTDFHDGPVSFNTEQNTIYITHVDLLLKKDKNFVNRSKLYTSTLKKNKWTKVVPFQYNSDTYSVAHASISADGQKLFFASDMPGGQGGMDIYVCEKQGEGWGQPKNLGSKVNTSGEEVFPYIRKDGVLFFSSDGHPGFGGLDVFSATSVNEKYTNVKNVGGLLNSSTDDFGIVFLDNTKGYFSSDRSGGKGSDDIYSFTALNKLITIEGEITSGQSIDNPFKNAEIQLLSEDGKVLNESTTNNKGFFKFDDLDADNKYLIKLDETDPKFFNKIKYYLVDNKGKFLRETGIDGVGGKFVFRNLPIDANASPEISSDGVTFAGNLLIGKNSSKPLANTKINLVNEKGEVVQTVYTNAFGAFVFTNLPADKNFMVKVDENDTKLALDTKIVLTNKSGKEVQTTESGDNGSFKFSFLAADKNTMKLMSVEDTDLRVDFKGKFMSEDNKTPLANSVVNLVNDKGEVLQTTTTDAFGAFQFNNLPADQNVLFALDENDTQLKTVKKIVLTDSKGGYVKEIKQGMGSFTFNVLPNDKQKLGTVYVDDPWLKVLQLKNQSATTKGNLTIIENIYYNYGKYEVLPETAKKLDKVIDVMENDPQLTIEISSHTDSRSSKEYNLKLSQQRANEAVAYMIKNGIAKNRISGKGYGESRLINKCADGVDCTEEEHAKNRRTEFQISRK